MNNNARYDRPTDTFELEVNVPRTIGILRDAAAKKLKPVQLLRRRLRTLRTYNVRKF